MVIRESRPQRSFDSSAGLIAVFHALHRLLAPRHPPHALSSLAALIPSSSPVVGVKKPASLQVTRPTPWGTWVESNDPILSRLMQRSQETTTQHAKACYAAVACESQLLPLPNCQRTKRSPQKGHRNHREEVRRFSPAKDSRFLHRAVLPARGSRFFFSVPQTRP